MGIWTGPISRCIRVLFTAIEVDKLPAPDIFEQRTFEAILAERLAEFRRLCPDYTAVVESDPVMKLLQASAYRELVLREQFNQRARGLLLPYSNGADLDNLAVPFGVQRKLLKPADPKTNTPAEYENDAAFRRRIQLAPESLSVAGPEGAYIFHTLSAHSGRARRQRRQPIAGQGGGHGPIAAGQRHAVGGTVEDRGVRSAQRQRAASDRLRDRGTGHREALRDPGAAGNVQRPR